VKAEADRKTDKEQMLAEMKADRKAWREEIRAETEAIRSRTEAMREDRMKANMDACMADIKDNRKETNDLPREDGGTSRRRRADLSGDET
jgi:hypothetical protein